MKNIKNKLVLVVVIALMTSCGVTMKSTKDIKYMAIHFKPLTRKDLTFVGDLTVTSTVTGKMTKGGKTLDKTYTAAYKKGLISKSEATEILYFSPGAGEAITGSLYENEVFNSVYTPAVIGVKKQGIIGRFFSKFFGAAKKSSGAAKADAAVDFAYYAMVEKYPDIDYFINVRFDRKIIAKGKAFSEAVTVYADGIKLKTD